jgi:hypothetical protein
LYESAAEWENVQIFKEDIVGVHLAGASVTKTVTFFYPAQQFQRL